MTMQVLYTKLSILALSIILALFVTALFVEFIEYEEIAKLLVMPMLFVGIAVTGYSILKSWPQS